MSGSASEYARARSTVDPCSLVTPAIARNFGFGPRAQRQDRATGYGCTYHDPDGEYLSVHVVPQFELGDIRRSKKIYPDQREVSVNGRKAISYTGADRPRQSPSCATMIDIDVGVLDVSYADRNGKHRGSAACDRSRAIAMALEPNIDLPEGA